MIVPSAGTKRVSSYFKPQIFNIDFVVAKALCSDKEQLHFQLRLKLQGLLILLLFFPCCRQGWIHRIPLGSVGSICVLPACKVLQHRWVSNQGVGVTEAARAAPAQSTPPGLGLRGHTPLCRCRW